jgi:hypothetical protein
MKGYCGLEINRRCLDILKRIKGLLKFRHSVQLECVAGIQSDYNRGSPENFVQELHLSAPATFHLADCGRRDLDSTVPPTNSWFREASGANDYELKKSMGLRLFLPPGSLAEIIEKLVGSLISQSLRPVNILPGFCIVLFLIVCNSPIIGCLGIARIYK